MSSEAQLRRLARHDAMAFGLDPHIFERQINQESGFNPRARSGAGALGIAQFMPATARGEGVNPLNPRQALRGAARLMASYVHKYGSYEKALIAYNAGPGAVGGKLPAETRNYVSTILGGSNPSARGVNPGGGGGGGGQTQTSQTVQLPQLGQVDVASLLAAVDQPRPVQVSAPPPPAFAAKGPPTPFGYTAPPQVGGTVQQQPSIDQLLQIAAQPSGLSPGAVTTTQTTQNPGGGGPGGQTLKPEGVKVAPTANRAGVGIKPITLRAVDRVASVFGHPLTIGTGTNHNRMTVDGNVSDHWDGHAADIPASGGTLTKLGKSALVAFGVSPGRARTMRGGLYNIQWHGHRVQVIFNTNQGGDHFNHLHVGIR